MNGTRAAAKTRRILGRINPDDFVGRSKELERLTLHPGSSGRSRGLLFLFAPGAGVSELLRQAYDALFNRRSDVVPIYFALTRDENTAVSTGIEFLNTFLLQYVAYRRNEPSLCESSLSLDDLIELALPADYQWIAELLEAYRRERFSNDHKALVRFCLSAPQRVPPQNGRPFVMIDGLEIATYLDGTVLLGPELLKALTRSNQPFVLAGLRRHVLKLVHCMDRDLESLDILRVEELSENEAQQLVENAARRQRLEINDEARDLIVQQVERIPFFMAALMRAAREGNRKLITYRDCEQLYVNDLMGGHINRHFASVLEDIAPEPQTRRSLITLLQETTVADDRRTSIETWSKRLGLEGEELDKLLQWLHIRELINWDGVSVKANTGSRVWRDYLKVRFRLEVANEPRALVVATTMADALKRAPHTMARHYRRGSTLRLRELLARFDSQRVPTILFHYDQYSPTYKGASREETKAILTDATDFTILPQVFHVASCCAFNQEIARLFDEEGCVVAHGFVGNAYSDTNETIWLVAEIDSKLELNREQTEMWCDKLANLAGNSGFAHFHLWLISSEGFSSEASALLKERNAYGSNRYQAELLAALLGQASSQDDRALVRDEFVMILPMGADNELLAAQVVEQVARRMDFRTEAINQIKTAVVEAWINAAEHSYSPDQKIYQRFQVENDKLVITISSRGVVPVNLQIQNIEQGPQLSKDSDTVEERRGWGLKLIQTLMDEVEFERVDEGTSLRMVKYLRS